MSTLIPTQVLSFTTPGEKLFYHFLQKTPGPDHECLAWYSPLVEGKEPDFVLYTPDVGLIVFEVKDWVLSQILGGDQSHFLLSIRNHPESRTNPQKQARDYTFNILDRIRSHGKPLISTDAAYYGKPKTPVHSSVVFTHILRSDFIEKGLDKILNVEKTLFADDLHSASPFSMDAAGHQFRKHLKRIFPPPFPFEGLNRAELAALREVLWPQVRISLPPRQFSDSTADTEAQIRQLDFHQESLARRLDVKKAILNGPAGSGKTLVLLHKAISEFKRHEGKRPVLVICFNITLVHYLRHILSEHAAPLGRSGIQVMHFYQFCNSLLREPLAEDESGEYYELVCGMALEAATHRSADAQYAAILVDEGQDFSDAMIAVLTHMLAENGLFWIAMDAGQKLYDAETRWRQHPEFRHVPLEMPYRATFSLRTFCERILKRPELSEKDDDAVPDCLRVASTKGKRPFFLQIKNGEESAFRMAHRIRELRKEGVPFSEIFILYATMHLHPEIGEGNYPLFLVDYLEEKGILCSWVSRSSESKRDWDCTTHRVAISTIHSMKGMDSAVVFVLGLDALEKRGIRGEIVDALAYVACSRARQELHLLYTEETPGITRLKGLV